MYEVLDGGPVSVRITVTEAYHSAGIGLCGRKLEIAIVGYCIPGGGASVPTSAILYLDQVVSCGLGIQECGGPPYHSLFCYVTSRSGHCTADIEVDVGGIKYRAYREGIGGQHLGAASYLNCGRATEHITGDKGCIAVIG